ncbi:hypothetical protein C8P64_0592 [Christiangramia gaetbulicola]|uniref:Uncharacterized protein n=1 Tax=Christiangramia gaetbulicola TaxID=703340 RepID=A0A2T6ALC5_9FLAO|nr:hypothetical protein C8P64_0592 [Christiangramia gaetbulicola]
MWKFPRSVGAIARTEKKLQRNLELFLFTLFSKLKIKQVWKFPRSVGAIARTEKKLQRNLELFLF